MNLTTTIKNIKNSKESFFNLNKENKNWVNYDLLRNGIMFEFKIIHDIRIIYFKKENIKLHDNDYFIYNNWYLNIFDSLNPTHYYTPYIKNDTK